MSDLPCDLEDGLYHTTSYEALASIQQHGLMPRRGGGVFAHGGYGEHSQGKVFLACGEYAALAWFNKVRDMLEYNAGDGAEPEQIVPVMLVVKPDGLPLHLDPVGNRDVRGSLYTDVTIPPEQLAVWVPDVGWIDLVDWDNDADADQGIREVEFFDEDGDPVDENDDWTSRSFTAYDASDSGGFKPDRGAEGVWGELEW